MTKRLLGEFLYFYVTFVYFFTYFVLYKQHRGMRPFLRLSPERNSLCTKPHKENKTEWSKIGACLGLAFIRRCWKNPSHRWTSNESAIHQDLRRRPSSFRLGTIRNRRINPFRSGLFNNSYLQYGHGLVQ